MTTYITASTLTKAPSRNKTRAIVLTAGGATLLAITSQILIPLGFTPVPLSLATLTVILLGTSLGPRLAMASTGLFFVLGTAGLPIFAGFSSGTATASFGYAAGYIFASGLAGLMAKHAGDKKVASAFLLAICTSVVIYFFGVPWLMFSAHLSLREGIALGVLPFIAGDLLKTLAAAALLPAIRRLIDTTK